MATYRMGLKRQGGYDLRGGHVIMLGPGNEAAAREALAAWPGGLQLGGGITETTAATTPPIIAPTTPGRGAATPASAQVGTMPGAGLVGKTHS